MISDSDELNRMELRLMAWLDGECDDAEAAEVARLVEDHPEWRAAAEEMATLIGRTNAELIAPPLPARARDEYWETIHKRIAKPRRAGWAMMAAGGMGLALVGAFKVFEFATNPWVRIGLGVLIAGFALTFIAVVRGHLLERPRDRYRKVKR